MKRTVTTLILSAIVGASALTAAGAASAHEGYRDAYRYEHSDRGYGHRGYRHERYRHGRDHGYGYGYRRDRDHDRR